MWLSLTIYAIQRREYAETLAIKGPPALKVFNLSGTNGGQGAFIYTAVFNKKGVKALIIDHTHPLYHEKWVRIGINRFNGAYYYSQEIVRNIIPNVTTTRNWMTINIPGLGVDHSIVFVHNNQHPEHYDWLRQYRDLIIVCGVPETVEKMQHLGKAIYLPLSIDVEEVKQYKCEKTKKLAFAGRPPKREGLEIPDDADILEGMPREYLLREIAQYRTVMAVGRTAIEAKCLGCRLRKYDPRFPNTSLWKVLDNKDAAVQLQKLLDEIDG